jgi:hypothetical protein
MQDLQPSQPGDTQLGCTCGRGTAAESISKDYICASDCIMETTTRAKRRLAGRLQYRLLDCISFTLVAQCEEDILLHLAW